MKLSPVTLINAPFREGGVHSRRRLNKAAFVDNVYLLSGRSVEGGVYSQHYGSQSGQR